MNSNLNFNCRRHDCDGEIYVLNDRCPDCGANYYANVNLASLPIETIALKNRYDQAIDEVEKHSAEAHKNLQSFESVVSKKSKAVQTTRFDELERLAYKSLQLENYHSRVSHQTQIPNGNKWEKLRLRSETELYAHNITKVHFLVLTLDDLGLPTYGGVHMKFKDNVMNRQAIAYHENNVIWHAVNKNPFNPGFRSLWSERSKLCIAKHYDLFLSGSYEENEFQDILLTRGNNTSEDAFIEIHAWKPLSIRHIEKVVLNNKQVDVTNAQLMALEKTLNNLSVELLVL